MSEPSQGDPPPKRRRSFSIAALLFLMTIAAVAAAAGTYFGSAARGQNLSIIGFMMITLAAPLGTALVVAAVLRIFGALDDPTQPPKGNRRYYG